MSVIMIGLDTGVEGLNDWGEIYCERRDHNTKRELTREIQGREFRHLAIVCVREAMVVWIAFVSFFQRS